MEFINNHGWIEVIAGPMFAGKSEELIRRVNRLNYAKQKYLVFKPSIDNRYDENDVVSHQKNKIKAIAISKANEALKYIDETIKTVAFDEVQFFDKDIIKVAENLANKGIRVICAGLDMDYRGDVFPITATLLAKAEYVTKLNAICAICGDIATRSQRIVPEQDAENKDNTILIGADESYEPRCRHCFEKSTKHEVK